MTSPQKISVCLPSFNSQNYLRKTLESLERQEFSAFEVIVVDCSEGGAVRDICAEFRFVSFRHEIRRFNPGIGRNIGARIATGELLIFIDTDVSLSHDALSKAWDFYQKGHRVFGGALELNAQSRFQVAAHLEHLFFNHESQRSRPASVRRNLSSALMCLERELFISNNGFRDIPRMQDTELTERLRMNGEILFFNPDVIGYQTQDSPIRTVLKKVYINGKNIFFIRYPTTSLAKRLLFIAGLPIISFSKIARIIIRHIYYQDQKNKLITITMVPLLALAGIFWMTGFYRSIIFGGGIDARRD
jgi:glycosyltransferase involved in cell wall biosynthesis